MSIGAEQDGYVQVATDGTGKKVDNADLTRDDGTEVYRQRVVLGSDENPRQQVQVRGEAGDVALMVDAKELGEIKEVLTEIRDILRMFCGA